MTRLIAITWVGLSLATMQAHGYSGGTGEPNDPYQIATAEDLIALGQEPNDYNDCFILTADIDLSSYSFDRAVIAPDINDSTSDFQGIGFGGIFSGQGHVVSGLHIEGHDYLGLFGFCTPEATITQLGLNEISINSSGEHIGGLVGHNEGAILSSYSVGDISGHASVVGGLVGYNNGWVNGLITSSYSMVTVSGKETTGGLVGKNEDGSIISCYSTGAVTSENSGGGRGRSVTSDTLHPGGGLVGSNGGDYGRATIFSSFWDIETSGASDSAGGTGLTTAEMQTVATSLEAGWDLVGESANGTCNLWVVQEGSYPSLAAFSGESPADPNGSGTPEDPYQLTDANDLGTVWSQPWATYRMENDIDLSGITWNSAVVPLFKGVFDGNEHVISHLHIEGYNYLGLFRHCRPQATIANLTLDAVDVNGIENRIGGLAGLNEGTIMSCNSDGQVRGLGAVGGLVGVNVGSLISSHNTATIRGSGWHVGGLAGYIWEGNITLSTNTGTVSSSDWYVGGIAGTNYFGSLTDSYNTGSVSGDHWHIGGLVGFNREGSISSCYNTGTIEGEKFIGGLAGINSGSITSCYQTGIIMTSSWYGGAAGIVARNSGSITSCYSAGTFSGAGDPVGITENDLFGSVTSCFWDTEISGLTDSDGGTGLTTSEMQDINTYLNAGWDFINETDNGTDDLWWIDNGQDYPHLWWEAVN